MEGTWSTGLRLGAPLGVSESWLESESHSHDGMPAGAHSCLRDINVGRDLSVTYRFSRDLLPQWRRLDAAVEAYVMDAFETPDDNGTS